MERGSSAYPERCSQDTDKRVSFMDSRIPEYQESSIVLKKPSQRRSKALAFSSSRLSSWPAYAPGQVILQNRKPCSFPEWQSTSKDHIDLSIPKPRYLEELESHLRKELQSLDLTKGKVQELRLQPYREVFEFFMEEFRTYKPLLASIKNEYELTIAHLQEMNHCLERENAILATAADQYTLQVLALQEQEKIEITKLKNDRIYLLKLIDKMKEEKCSLETQVSKMRKTVAAEYLRYLNECDARKLLLIDLNEMYRLKEEIKLTKVQDEGKGEDSVKLMLALKMARQDLTKAQVELNTLKANYGDVVPRRDFESQGKKYEKLYEEMMTLQNDYDEVQEEYNTMLDIHKQVSEERDQFYNDFLNVQRSSTPRPEWAKCAEVIPGGAERWSALSQGKSSDQLVDVLLEDLGAALLREKDTFVALGRSEKVPVYLRCDGLIRNKKLSKREVVAILREIWKDKMASDLQKGKRSSLSEFFLNFFQRRYGEAIAFDWTYTIYENIKLFRSNEPMSLFYQVLTGNLEEGVYHTHTHQLSNLLKELSAIDTTNTGQLTAEQFILGLKSAFPLKTEEQIQELTEAAGYKLDHLEDVIMYRILFLEDEEGKTEPFIAKIKNQYVNEKKVYLRELRAILGTLMDVRPDDLRAAFCVLDPGLTDNTLDYYVCLAFQINREQLDPSVSLPLETVMQRLKAGDVRQRGTAIQSEPKNLHPTTEESEINT